MRRKICLRDAVITVIQTAKAMGKPRKAAEVERAKAMGKKNMEAIANHPKRAEPEHAAPKDCILARSRWLAKPQWLIPLLDAFSLLYRR